MTMLSGADAPNPQGIADAVVALIEAPAGQRTTGVVVGNSFGADLVNDATAPSQAGTVAALGLAYLDAS